VDGEDGDGLGAVDGAPSAKGHDGIEVALTGDLDSGKDRRGGRFRHRVREGVSGDTGPGEVLDELCHVAKVDHGPVGDHERSGCARGAQHGRQTLPGTTPHVQKAWQHGLRDGLGCRHRPLPSTH